MPSPKRVRAVFSRGWFLCRRTCVSPSDSTALVERTAQAEMANGTVGLAETLGGENGGLFAPRLDRHLDRGEVAPWHSAPNLRAVEADDVVIEPGLQAVRERSCDKPNRQFIRCGEHPFGPRIQFQITLGSLRACIDAVREHRQKIRPWDRLAPAALETLQTPDG